MFIRINPDKKVFNIFQEINKIHRQIKKSTRKSWIDDLSKRLLELETNHSIKPKCLRWIVKTNSTNNIRHEKPQSKIKSIKSEKKLEQSIV